MYGGEIVKVARALNGFTVSCYLPSKDEKTGSMNHSCCVSSISYEDPWKNYVFESAKEAGAFIASKLDLLNRKSNEDEFEDTFKEVATDE